MHPLFEIPELLVHVVLYLDHSDLVPCYLVSHHWLKILRRNLPPHKRPLPDSDASQKCLNTSNSNSIPQNSSHRVLNGSKSLPRELITLASQIHIQNVQWLSLTRISLPDDYYFWLDGAHSNLLSHLAAHLHPFLANHALSLVDGVTPLAEGSMDICLRTECSVEDYLNLFEEVKDLRMLTYPVVQSVEINCPRGGKWDKENKSVLTRKGATWRYQCVRVDREKGVRMCDVFDELRGVLKPQVDGEKLLLEWWFGKQEQKQHERSREQITRSMLEG